MLDLQNAKLYVVVSLVSIVSDCTQKNKSYMYGLMGGNCILSIIFSRPTKLIQIHCITKVLPYSPVIFASFPSFLKSIRSLEMNTLSFLSSNFDLVRWQTLSLWTPQIETTKYKNWHSYRFLLHGNRGTVAMLRNEQIYNVMDWNQFINYWNSWADVYN